MPESRLPTMAGTIWICTNLAGKFTKGIPVREKDFSQSAVEGPSMFPSMKARPGPRVQVAPCAHSEQPDKSLRRIERTSFNGSELRQMSRKRSWRTLPQDKGNCTQG